MAKIGFVGTMSVGKTSLVKELAKLDIFKDYHITTERSKYLNDLGIPLNTDSTIKGQIIFSAERASELMYDNLLTDRTILDVMSFTKQASSIIGTTKVNFEYLMKDIISEYDIMFYISPKGMDIEDNNIRETDPEYRNDIDKTILYYIEKYKHKINNLHIIEGMSLEDRVKFVLEKYNEYLYKET